MVASVVNELGAWNWMVLGFALLALEVIVPGVFLLWIGIAAIITGLLSLQFWDAAAWTWQVQVLLFLGLSLVCAYLGYRITRARGGTSDEPLLNQRGDQLIGRTATLAEPITEGYGRIRLNDTLWRIAGPDLPVGTRVRVVAAHGNQLDVEPVIV